MVPVKVSCDNVKGQLQVNASPPKSWDIANKILQLYRSYNVEGTW